MSFLPVDPEDEPTFHCHVCRDESAGWRPFWCPGAGKFRTFEVPAWGEGSIVDCGRRRPDDGHNYRARCECFETNPVIQARREREQRRRVEREQRKGHAA